MRRGSSYLRRLSGPLLPVGQLPGTAGADAHRGDLDGAAADSVPRPLLEMAMAGFPRTKVFGATLSNTTLPAETTASGPISTPGAMKLAAAIQLPSRTVIGATRSLKSSR